MKAVFDPLLRFLSKLGKRQQLLGFGLAGVLGFAVMYWIVLGPYIGYFGSLQGELNAHRQLLNTRQLREKAIAELGKAYQEFSVILDGIDASFFSEEEADVFLKSLPGEVSRFGNRVTALKPKTQAKMTTRSDEVTTYIRSLKVSTEGKVLALVSQNKQKIDVGDGIPGIETMLSRMIPVDKRDGLAKILKQAGEGPMATAEIQVNELSLSLRGGYQGILSVFEWLAGTGKIIRLEEVRMTLTPAADNAIETDLVIAIYVRKSS